MSGPSFGGLVTGLRSRWAWRSFFPPCPPPRHRSVSIESNLHGRLAKRQSPPGGPALTSLPAHHHYKENRMPSRLGPSSKQGPRLKVPKGMQVTWVPKTPAAPSAAPAAANPVEQQRGRDAAYALEQGLRLSKGLGPDEGPNLYAPTRPTSEDQRLMALNRTEQGPRHRSGGPDPDRQ